MSSNRHDAQASTNYKEAFSLFDKRGNGRVTRDSLGDLLRACGQNPTMSEIRDLEKTVGGDCKSKPVARPFFEVITLPHEPRPQRDTMPRQRRKRNTRHNSQVIAGRTDY